MTLTERLSKLWAARSLGIGALATLLDLTAGGLVLWAGAPTRVAAMSGFAVGATFGYFANRHFAFNDHQEPVAKSGVKFVVVQVVLGVIHGQVVKWLRDSMGVPYAFSKMMADLMVVTGPQLLLMRYFIFPKQKQGESPR